MSIARSLALATIWAALIAAVVFVLGSAGGDTWFNSVPSQSQQPTVSQHRSNPLGSEALPDTEHPAQTVELVTAIEPNAVATDASGPAAASTAAAPAPASDASAPSAAPAAAVQAAPTRGQVRLRIPALGVNASVTPLGFDGAGGYAVPTTAAGVGWYEFSAYPGAAGNAVLGGHLNWRGSRGVFDRLDELSAGDMIYVDTAAGEIAYRVVGSHSVGAHTPFVDILGERSGPSTLTLFTCGGTYSKAAGEYDQRLVVNAVRA